MSLKSTPHSKRRILKMVSRTWLATGAIAVIYGLTATSCAPVVDANGAARINFAAVEAAPETDRLVAARALWQAESGAGGDPFSAGYAAYEIASVTHDPKWSSEAIARLGAAQDAMPEFAQATAWRGSAHALAARDFPLQGAWQVIPGPGFVRIYHVQRAKSLLNAAVAQAPNDPVVRLIRAATLANMPAFFVDETVVDADFALMAQWDAEPQSNPDFADILTADKWRTDFYTAYAAQMTATGEPELAAAFLNKRPTYSQKETL